MLRMLGLPYGHFAVFGSGPLLVRGIIEDATDLDVIARGPAWLHAIATGTLVDLEKHGITVASFFDGAITVGIDGQSGVTRSMPSSTPPRQSKASPSCASSMFVLTN